MGSDLTPRKTPDSNGDRNLTGREVGQLSAEAIVASLPWIGPAIQVAVFGRLNEIRYRRLSTLVTELEQRLGFLEHDPQLVTRIVDALANDERFMLFVRECLAKLTEEYEPDKFRAYKEALIAGITDQTLAIDLKMEFLNVLRRVGTKDLHVLGYLSTKSLATYESTSAIITRFATAAPASRLLILSAIDTLADSQLIEAGKIGLDDNGILRRDLHEYRLTELGRLFTDFVRLAPVTEPKAAV